MAPGILEHPSIACTESRPSKRFRLSATEELQNDDEDVAIALPSHPLGVKPAGNAYTASENIKSRCGSFARLPDELLSHILESFDADTLIRLGSTCRALYAFTRLDDLWRALFVSSPPSNFTWRGTWQATYLNTPTQNITSLSCANLFSDTLYRPFQCAHTPLAHFSQNIPASNAIPRLPDLTHADYSANWTNKPFILTTPVKSWPIYKTWTPSYLLAQFSDTKFRAEAVDWPLSTYISYMRNQTDESPLYLFDPDFASKTSITTTSTSTSTSTAPYSPPASYTPPSCFGTDLFTLLTPHRPHHTWLILGPPRSGSTFHADPNATCAWNAVLTGRKYWILFPPHVAVPGVIVSDDGSEITAPLSIAEYLLTFHALARATPGCSEGVCGEGEVVYVPSGWMHLVLNLEETLAVTQNFVPGGRVADVLGFLRERRGEVSGFEGDLGDRAYEMFVERLGEEYPGVLEEGLAELERRGKKGRGRGRWEELTKGDDGDGEEEGRGGGFSFGFGFGGDEEDADIP